MHVNLTPQRVAAFWAKVNKTDGCWLWTGTHTKAGYGVFLIGRRREYAHRIAHVLGSGRPIPDGWYACHRCDNPPCVRPDHLFAAPPAENISDMIAKKRSMDYVCPERRLRGDDHPARVHPEYLARGEAHPAAKLTAEQVTEIRRVWAAREATQAKLAARFGVSQVTIGHVVLRKVWKHVP